MHVPHPSINRLSSAPADVRRLRPRRLATVVGGAGLALVASILYVTPAEALTVAADTVSGSHLTRTRITTTVTDPDDTDGRFDIARVRHVIDQVDRHHVTLTYSVSTYVSFSEARLNAQRRNFVLELNRDGGWGSERNVRISREDGHLVAEVISNATREVIDTVTAYRPDNRAVVITGPRSVLGARSYFWTSNFHTARPSACGWGDGYPITCQDSVPQDGWIRLDRPAWPETP